MTEMCQGVPTMWNLYIQTLLFPEITDRRSQFVSTKLIAFYRFGRYFITTHRHKVPTQNWVRAMKSIHSNLVISQNHWLALTVLFYHHTLPQGATPVAGSIRQSVSQQHINTTLPAAVLCVESDI